MEEGDVISFLNGRRKWIDGVCITGGEPCLHMELPGFVKKVKDEGFLVKLDTNGTNPSKAAHAGAFEMLNVNESPSASLAVGVKL